MFQIWELGPMSFIRVPGYVIVTAAIWCAPRADLTQASSKFTVARVLPAIVGVVRKVCLIKGVEIEENFLVSARD